MSIGRKLITLLLFIGLLPTIVVGTVAYITISHELNTKTDDQLASISIKQEQKINGLLQKKQEDVTRLVNKYDFQVALGQYLASNTDANRQAMVDILQDKKIEVTDIQAISVANLENTIIASTVTGTTGQKLTVTLPNDQSTVTTVREDPRDGMDKLYITTSVSVNKKQSASLSTVFRIDDIIAAVQDYTGLGNTGETVIAEKDINGKAVSLFPLRFNTDAALNTPLDSLQLFSHTDSTYRAVKDYRKHDVIVSARSVGFADWVIATKQDSAEALAPIMQLRNSLIGIVIVSSLIIIFIALGFARFFTAPIIRIGALAKRIGQGDFSARIDLRRNDEIGALGTSVNTMGASLNDFVTHIETQRHRLEVILNSTEESIVAADKNNVIIIANKATATLTGLDLSDIVGKNISDIFHWKRDTDEVSIDYHGAGTNSYIDLQYVSHDGLTHYVNISVTNVDAQAEQDAQSIITIHDETKSRDLENMKIDFVSMAAHELRTPLAAIRGYLELVSFKEKTTVTPDVAKYISQAIKSTSELGSLINNLLDVTRIERGTLTLNMDQVDLAASIAQAVNDARFSAQDKHITLNYSGPQSGNMVFADNIAIHEVINNLVTNAIKYTHPNGQVTVELLTQGSSYTVRVKDSGIGIPQQAIPNLFTKFYRVHGGLNSGNSGTGLGLFIAKSIIERHAGTIAVESQEGVGSTFTFTLPKLDATQSSPVKQQTEGPTRRSRGWTTQNIAR